MRTKLFLGSAVAGVLAVVTAAFAGVFTPAETASPEPVKAVQASTQTQPCCPPGECCPECLACCAEDGCCWECILCCIAMGCDPSCCFPAAATAKAETPRKAESCCGDGCCK
jgi:hypothetical protein